MSKKTDYNISEDDLAVFPPYLSLFLLATFLLMISHGIAASVICFFYFPLPPGIALALTVSSAMVFVIFNIMIIRGHPTALKALKILAVTYFLVAVSSFLNFGHTAIDVRISLTLLGSSISAWLVLGSKGYGAMASFMAKRWRFYRETGSTIIEELNRK